LHESSELEGIFKELDPNIASAITKEGSKKYKNNYTFMDDSELYYTALVLDPWVKGDLILQELEDKEAGNLILKDIHDRLCQKYLSRNGDSLSYDISYQSTPTVKHSSMESQML
jgi:hypothetical protein